MSSYIAASTCGDHPGAAKKVFGLLTLHGLLSLAVPTHAAEVEGAAVDAQPGLHRVGVAQAARPTVAVTAGYGYTEPQSDADGGHHRLSLKLAGAVAVAPFLNVAPYVGVRHDIHPGDSGTVIDASLAARAFLPLEPFHLGAELKLWVPGSESASTLPDSLSLDSRVLLAKRLENLLLACHLGYRLDRSAAVGTEAARLAPGDRLALGVSGFNALLVGLGAGLRIDRSELYVEASGDLLVGSGAPPLGQSPLRATLGLRQVLTQRLSAEGSFEASLSGRPRISATAPLIPIEPRLSVFAGIRYEFGAQKSAATSEPAPTPAPMPRPAPSPVVIAPPVAEAAFALSVVDEEGAPVANATLRVAGAGEEQTFPVDGNGTCRADHLAPGATKFTFEASGFESLERTLTLEPGAPLTQTITLKALPPPSQVRGVVRSYGGKGLAARIRVEPLGVDARTDANGAFQVDVPPGSYEVVVEADGYQPQRRKISVTPQGVVILNADLKKP
ncbi:MAG TPA: carboxypeptidase regulatory-like domain-containing protein [Polyangiaceae bacterium]|nr:carboxypeptidase regulatory-like domain-containing protein [Polyangiaceae bacterium]